MMDNNNIFKYALKELSQDAFLMWLFNNWNSKHPDVRKASLRLLCKMIDIPYDNYINITDLRTIAQRQKIDILVDFKIDDKKYIIVIEDKINSFEHDEQLFKYRKYVLDYFKDYDKKAFIFYKSSLMSRQEIQDINNQYWTVFDIHMIYKIFFNSDIKANHYLLKSYRDYIKENYELLMNDLPDNIAIWHAKQWQNFAFNSTWELPNDISMRYDNYRNLYIFFAFHIKNKENITPYLEIRSRDLSNGKFIARIQIYNIDEYIVNKKLLVWENKIKQSLLFKAQKHKKQIGINILKEEIKTVHKIQEIAIKYINEFNKLF
jgi:hypothetical protein